MSKDGKIKVNVLKIQKSLLTPEVCTGEVRTSSGFRTCDLSGLRIFFFLKKSSQMIKKQKNKKTKLYFSPENE